jgi:hypothetical protein
LSGARVVGSAVEARWALFVTTALAAALIRIDRFTRVLLVSAGPAQAPVVTTVVTAVATANEEPCGEEYKK